MKKIPLKTSHQEIIEHWSVLIDEADIAVDWCDAHLRCWRCAKKKKTLDRCHIIPESLGGIDDPSNLILLCNSCHKEAPDVLDPKIIWSWIKRTKAIYYDTWDAERATDAYADAYGESVTESLVSVLPLEIKSHKDFIRIVDMIYRVSLVPAFKMASMHFGVGLSDSTRIFIMRKAVDLIGDFFRDQQVNFNKSTIKDTALYIAKKHRDYLLSICPEELSLKPSDFKEELSVT